MGTREARRVFAENLSALVEREVQLKGWVYHLRILGKTAFIVLRDRTGEAQCVIASAALKEYKLKAEDVIEVLGTVRDEPRARAGCEVDISEIRVLNRAGQGLPFQSAANAESIGLDTLVQYRPLSLRTEGIGDIFRIQAAILNCLSRCVKSSAIYGNRDVEDRRRRNGGRQQPLRDQVF